MSSMLRMILLMWPPYVILSSRVSPASKWRIWRNADFIFGKYIFVQEVTHQNARASQTNVIEGFASKKLPETFRKLRAILVQVKILAGGITGAPKNKGRKGHGVVAGG